MNINEIEIFALSEQGPREENEDAYAVVRKETSITTAVFDGLGGHSNGKQASTMLAEFFKNDCSERNLEELIKDANEELLQNENHGFTTVAAVRLENDGDDLKVSLCNCGDSRIYLLNRKEVVVLSKDHTTESELIQMGVNARIARYNRKLTSCAGIRNTELCYQEFKLERLAKEEVVAILTDGAWEMFDEECEFLRANQLRTAKAKVDYLLGQLQHKKNKLNDNATCIFLYASEDRGLVR